MGGNSTTDWPWRDKKDLGVGAAVQWQKCLILSIIVKTEGKGEVEKVRLQELSLELQSYRHLGKGQVNNDPCWETSLQIAISVRDGVFLEARGWGTCPITLSGLQAWYIWTTYWRRSIERNIFVWQTCSCYSKSSTHRGYGNSFLN
jgi:hypothetical protein